MTNAARDVASAPGREPTPATRPMVLIIAFSDMGRDPRVSRQLLALVDDYRVVAAGLGEPGIPGVEFIHIDWPDGGGTASRIRNVPRRLMREARLNFGPILPARMRASAYERVYWSSTLIADSLARLSHLRPEAVIANDIDTLPLALRLASGAPVIFDAHEYAPREYDNSLAFRMRLGPYRRYLGARYIPAVAAMTTVCQGVADSYEADSGVTPLIITNAPPYEPLEPYLPAADAPVRMIHHGMGAPVRRIENMLRVMDFLDDRFHLDFMLVPSPASYVRKLERMTAGDRRIRFLPLVPMRDIARATNAYDIGLFLLEPSNFNYLHALPNKFFEFVQARLAVAIGPSPEMAALVRKHDLGVVSPDFSPESLARRLRVVTRTEITGWKWNAHAVARELSAERNTVILRDVVQRVRG